MDRRQFVLASGVAITGALAGCLGNAPSTAPAAPAGAQSGTSAERNGRTITVVGSGEAEADPDLAVLIVRVEAEADDAETVRATLAEDAATLRTALLEAGIDEENVTTTRYHVSERRRRPRPAREGEPAKDEESERYYQGVHGYEVEIDDVDRVGAIIDVAVDAGADDVGHVQFTLAEDTRDELRIQALRTALEEARQEAETIAEAIGAEILEETSVTTAEVDVRPYRAEPVAMEAGDGGGGPPTEIDQGPVSVSVSARVEVTYRIA